MTPRNVTVVLGPSVLLVATGTASSDKVASTVDSTSLPSRELGGMKNRKSSR